MGILVAAVAVYLAPALFGGHTFTASPLMYDFPPWQPYPPVDKTGNVNHLLSDNPLQIVQWQSYARSALRSGHLPTWNPLVLTGTPFLGNAQTALAAPTYLPLWILPFDYALGVVAAIKLLIAALGAFLLARSLGMGRPAAVLSGVTYSFCAFNIVWLSHPHTNVSGLLPWTLWLTERALRSGRPRDGLLVGLPVAAAFLGGHPGTQLHLLFALGIYVGARLIWPAGESRAGIRALGGLLVGIILGVASAAAVLLPAVLAISSSAGQEVRQHGGFTLPAKSLVTLLFPDLWGRPNAAQLGGGPLNYAERTLNVGVIALLLAGLALTTRDTLRQGAPILVVSMAGLLVAFGVEPVHWAVTHIPGLSDVRDARLILLPQLGLAVLAGFGLERLMRADAHDRAIWAVLAIAGIVSVAAVIAIGPDLDAIRTTINHFRTGNVYPDRPAVIQLTAVAWFALLAAGLCAAFLLRVRLASPWPALLLLAALVALDIGRFVAGYQPMPESSAPFAPNTTAIEAMRTTAGDGRIVAFTREGFIFPPDSGMAFYLRDVRGDDPPQPNRRYRDLWDYVEPRVPGANEGLNLSRLTPQGRRVLDVLGVRAVLTPTAPAPLLDYADLRLVYDETDGRVYEDLRAAPRAFVPSRVTQADGEDAALATVTAPSFDAAHDAVVEGSDEPRPAAQGSARITTDQAERVQLDADLERGGLVVLGDAFDEGWSVKVDGRPAEALRVNSVLRGVSVPAGRHTIDWTYRAPGLRAGLAISAAALLAALGIAAMQLPRRRRRRRHLSQ